MGRKLWEEKTVPVPISRAYNICSIQCKQDFGPVHEKAGKPKRDPAASMLCCGVAKIRPKEAGKPKRELAWWVLPRSVPKNIYCRN